MSVVGIDFGYQSTLVAAPRAGGIDVLLNDYSQRKTASMVCFGEKQREIGEAAKAKSVMKVNTTITNFKHLIGRRFNDPTVQEELKRVKFKTCEAEDGGIAVTVQFLGEARTLSVTQVLGMLLTKIKKIAEEQLNNKVSDCVVAVPVFFNDRQRHAMLTAIKIADLNCLRLFNETTAVALSYGIYKLDLPAPTEKARRVVFCDLGHSALQLSCSEFCQGKLTVLATAFDTTVGGRAFDEAIMAKFCAEFLTKYKKDVAADKKASGKLELECEKLKQTMSSISTSVPLNIECLIDEIDVAGRVERSEMETLCAGILTRIEDCCKNLISEMKKQKGW
jgi:molecular chaperone DnaK (HSP70)